MENLYRELVAAIGEDVSREGLRDTPRRAAKALQYLTKGYQEDIDKIVNNALFTAESDDMVIVRDIELYSLCEHHLLPFIGKCYVGYIPDQKIIGLSKIPRIVDAYARRLQVQERLTKQIANTLLKYTAASGVGVVIEAQHLCTMMRGVEKQNSVMTTSCMLGSFRRESATRAEFLALIKQSSH
jgi:GTP cyclohydrolase I